MTMIPFFHIAEVLPFCCKECVYTFEEHTFHRMVLSRFESSMTLLDMYFLYISADMNIYVKKEVAVDFLTDLYDGRWKQLSIYVLVCSG